MTKWDTRLHNSKVFGVPTDERPPPVWLALLAIGNHQATSPRE